MAIDDDVKKAIEQNRGFVVIMAGSDSDAPHINKISEELNKYTVPHQVRICSAHKQPEKLMETLREYEQVKGALAYVAVAGGTDALSGTLAFHAARPVISCPPDAPNESCLTNPPGSSNSYIKRPGNAARHIAQMFAHLPNTHYKTILEKETTSKIAKLQVSDGEFSKMPYTPKEK